MSGNGSGIRIGAKQLNAVNKPRSRLSGNKAGFRIGGQELREAATRRSSLRRDRNSRDAEKRERLERAKELGNVAPMTVDELKAAIVFCKEKFGIVLTSWGSFSKRPKFSARELWALAAAVEEGVCYRDRVIAVRRLQKIGFRVSFTEGGPRPAALR